MNIEITPKKAEGLDRTLEIKIPVDLVRDAEEKATRHYASRVRLPGFRPGKAPPGVIKKRFKDEIRQQVIESLVQDAYKEVLEREQLKVVSQPHIHDLKFTDGEPVVFELHLEVRPEITLARTEGFRIAQVPAEVPDDAVTKQLDQIREQKAAWAPATDNPKEGDMVTVQLATAEESGEIHAPQEVRLVIGDGRAIPGIEEVIMSLKAGENAERQVRWPDDFPDEAQRGKLKTVRVALDDVKRKSLPPLDDAFAREVGDFDSLDALTTAVRTDMAEDARRGSESQMKTQLLDAISDANPFDIPQSWVSSLVENYMQGYEIPDSTKDRFRDEFRPLAERQVRRNLIIDTLAEREGLRATEADVDARISETAEQRGMNASQMYASLQKAGRLNEIEQSITEERVFAWLFARNEVGSLGR